MIIPVSPVLIVYKYARILIDAFPMYFLSLKLPSQFYLLSSGSGISESQDTLTTSTEITKNSLI